MQAYGLTQTGTTAGALAVPCEKGYGYADYSRTTEDIGVSAVSQKYIRDNSSECRRMDQTAASRAQDGITSKMFMAFACSTRSTD